MLRTHSLRALLVTTFAALPVLAPGTATAAAPDGACTDQDGVTVVVDATALGREIDVACATEAPATGTAALEATGHAITRDPSGFLCALDALPDPCPVEFTGEYWSYWHLQDGAWVSYQEGSDTAVPTPGGAEGWAWGDGSTPPAVDPADLAPAVDSTEATGDATDQSEGDGAAGDGTEGDGAASQAPGADAVPTLTAATTSVEDPAEGAPWWPIPAAVLAVAAVVVAILARRRQQQAG